MSSASKAYIAPFAVFLLMIGLQEAVLGIFKNNPSLVFSAPQYWVYPLQTIVCGGLVAAFWRHYEKMKLARIGFTVAIAILVFVIWISPQIFFSALARREGFDPTIFPSGSALYVLTLAMRFLRLAVVVPFLEEIFWRGFLLRWMVREDFENVPFGAFSWPSFAVVTLGFTFEHQRVDWPAAALAGVLYNLVAYRTRSLGSCVLAHAATNLLLGLYVLHTRQWGFW